MTWKFLPLLCLLASTALAESRPPQAAARARTVAVLSVDAGASRDTVDAVMLALAGAAPADTPVALVEREGLEQLAREQVIAKLGDDAHARVDVGRLVGADVLALVGRGLGPAGAGVRVIVCDSATGARLAQLHVKDDEAAPELLAREVLDALARFPGGVRSVVGVPDLISRDLQLDHADLQGSLAEMLRDSLARHRGLAVLEVDEAKSIAVEGERAGAGDVRRVVPVYVEGEYRTDPLADGGPRVSIVVTLRTAGRELAKIESGAVPLGDAGRFMLEDVQRKLLDVLDAPAADPFDAARELERLVARADRFAEIGEFDRSAALREAALLLNSAADRQRVRLVRDYARWNREPVEAWPAGRSRTPDDPFWAGVVARGRENWRRSLRHVEHLVRNKRVDLKEGSELFREAVDSISGLGSPALFAEEERLKKEFVREVGPRLVALPVPEKEFFVYSQRVRATAVAYHAALARVDGKPAAEKDYRLAGDLVCELLPEDAPVVEQMISDLSVRGWNKPGPHGRGDREAWERHVERLFASPRPMVNAYARYVRLRQRIIVKKDRSPELLDEARALQGVFKAYMTKGLPAVVKERAGKGHGSESRLEEFARDEVKSITRLLKEATAGAPAPPH